jgi:hypothetical protein
MPQPPVIAKLTSGVVRAFGQVTEIEVDLHGRHARQLLKVALSEKDPAIIRSDDLHVGAAFIAPQIDSIGRIPRVAVDVDGVQSEARKLVQRPCRRQPSERVIDLCTSETVVQLACKLYSRTGGVADNDVVASEAGDRRASTRAR